MPNANPDIHSHIQADTAFDLVLPMYPPPYPFQGIWRAAQAKCGKITHTKTSCGVYLEQSVGIKIKIRQLFQYI